MRDQTKILRFRQTQCIRLRKQALLGVDQLYPIQQLRRRVLQPVSSLVQRHVRSFQ
jgi:hypothetical protein